MLNRTLAKFIFYGVAIVLLVWTSSLTYSFLSMALPNTFWAVPLLGLVVFDVGMIAWLFVFLSHAEGSIQRAVSISLTMFNFVGVGLMVIAEILLDGQQMVEAPELLGTAAVWGIGIWTIANVFGVLVFHLGDNNARREMAMQSERDAVFDAALKSLSQMRAAIQQELADEMAGSMLEELERQVKADSKRDAGGDGTPDIYQRGAQNKRSNDAVSHESARATSVNGAGAGVPPDFR